MYFKKISFSVLLISFCSASATSQIVSSSCITSDSIVNLYQDDAHRLTLRRIYDDNLNFIDSLYIPQPESDTILDALIAVYNATSLIARDTVVQMFNIHTFPNPVMNDFVILADTSLYWMQELKIGNAATGHPIIDNVISFYGFNNINYSEFPTMSYDMVSFECDTNYNLPIIISSIDTIIGIIVAEPNGYIGDGNDIYDSIYSDHVELIYERAWGDCPSGCMSHRYWKFNIYFDCSVEFVESWGSEITFIGIEDKKANQLLLYPNPFINQINISGVNSDFDYLIYNFLGELIMSGKSSENQILDLDVLPSGQYLLSIKTDHISKIFRIVKNQ